MNTVLTLISTGVWVLASVMWASLEYYVMSGIAAFVALVVGTIGLCSALNDDDSNDDDDDDDGDDDDGGEEVIEDEQDISARAPCDAIAA